MAWPLKIYALENNSGVQDVQMRLLEKSLDKEVVDRLLNVKH